MSEDIDVLVGGFGALQGSHSPGIEWYVLHLGHTGHADYVGRAGHMGRTDSADSADSAGYAGPAIHAAADVPGVSLERAGLLSDLPSPSWLERDGDMVYAVLENSDELAALRLTRVGGEPRLELVSRVPVPSAGPTHVTVAVDDRGARHAIVACYVGGAVCVFPIGDGGGLGEVAQVLHGEGHGPLPAQEGPHAHWALALPDGRVLSTDLGADRIHVHRWRDGVLVRVGSVVFAPGTGPRDMHLLPSRDGAWRVAVVGEWGDTVTVLGPCSGEPETGGIGVLDTVDLGGDDGDQAASLAFVPDGGDGRGGADLDGIAGVGRDGASGVDRGAESGMVYVGLRGSERIVALHWDGSRLHRLADAGKPGWRGRGVSSGGSLPRHLCAVGRVVIAANEVSDDLTVFRIAFDGEPVRCLTLHAGSPTTVLPLD
ncbi:beta-propeller fold lactonase family protein [Bifidobacterium sp. CP2]|uniref:lactonase family protein n=1 Tax=Bifidobacterium sp. CP2 TaxID=2809025 RepID=UPI001C2FF8F1|nr:beta-propeller fold lactonase family protein [Bifidobacterium sp. CP2]